MPSDIRAQTVKHLIALGFNNRFSEYDRNGAELIRSGMIDDHIKGSPSLVARLAQEFASQPSPFGTIQWVGVGKKPHNFTSFKALH